MPSVICSVSTRGRYHTTLPLTLQAIAMQTEKPDRLYVFDDNDEPIDVRELPHYRYLFQILELNGIKWDWVFAGKKGQHHNHQAAKIRAERNQRLAETDWTQLADAPVDSVLWSDYRQQLRDVTKQHNFPSVIIWPTQPDAISRSNYETLRIRHINSME